MSTSLLAFNSSLVKKFGGEKPSFIAIGFGAIPAYSTVAVVGLDILYIDWSMVHSIQLILA